jgi:hypothetical protein
MSPMKASGVPLAPSDALMLLWEKIKPQFVQHFKSQRQLPPVWTTVQVVFIDEGAIPPTPVGVMLSVI